jgi:adenylosuccinate synthase
MTDESQFPKELNEYIAFLEKELEIPIKVVSVGPDRKQTIHR